MLIPYAYMYTPYEKGNKSMAFTVICKRMQIKANWTEVTRTVTLSLRLSVLELFVLWKRNDDFLTPFCKIIAKQDKKTVNIIYYIKDTAVKNIKLHYMWRKEQ